MIPGYIKDADCCLIVFDASNKYTLYYSQRKL